MNKIPSSRKEFRGLLDAILHPSGSITQPDQLKGRAKPLNDILDCFETPGSQAFIWGARGVGKTSLGHTACEKHNELVTRTAAIACEKNTTTSQMFTDIVRSVMKNNQMSLKDSKFNIGFEALGIKLATNGEGIKENFIINTPNEATALLNVVFSISNYPELIPVVVIDEFDRLQNPQTLAMLSSILKQISVDELRVKFVFCGVATDLNELIGSHESVERYVYGIELNPLSHDAIWEIVEDVELAFGIQFSKGQTIRISQIASGYPHFAHLILKNVLLKCFETGFTGGKIDPKLYKSGIHASAEQAATRLKTAYDKATKRHTDRYVEVLWAVANDKHLERQFKDIISDYNKIMIQRPDRNGYDTIKNNGADLRNALNALVKNGVLHRNRSGWYQFVNPMLRSYVRMVAENNEVELSDESFKN